MHRRLTQLSVVACEVKTAYTSVLHRHQRAYHHPMNTTPAGANPLLERLQPYPFAKLAALKGHQPSLSQQPHLSLALGEPQHPTPTLITETLLAHRDCLATYPNTKGLGELRTAIADWLSQRFGLPLGLVDPERQILPATGSREALFACAQALIDASRQPAQVLMPNPFYQIYEGAALLAGAQPVLLSTTADTQFQPDFSAVAESTWRHCQLLYLCSPSNPTGAVLSLETLQWLIAQAHRYDFVIAADECYSEIYPDETQPPPGLLQAAFAMGLEDFQRCLVFHSLSKRSNAPGLRSGFVAGDAALIERFLLYRTYHGCAMPLHHQHASRRAWQDEAHVRANRALYRAKFDAVLEILGDVLDCQRPQGGFYLWARTPISETEFARRLFIEHNVTVLPGRFLSRIDASGHDPGQGFVRIALVPTLADCIDAATRIRHFITNLSI